MWTETEIDQVENIYIGLWSSGVAGPKLKVFIDAVRRFPPEVVIESLEYIAKTQEKDLRPSIKTITGCCVERMPVERTPPKPCDDTVEPVKSFREFVRENRDVECPRIMLDCLDDDDPRKKVKTNGTEEVGAAPDSRIKQQDDSLALGAAKEGKPGMATGH